MLTVEEYLQSDPIKLPFLSSKLGLEINRLRGTCFKCKRETEDLRGTIIEHENCIEARYAGACRVCKGVTSHQIRWYPKDRIIMMNGERGWIRTRMKRPGLLGTVLDKIESLFTGEDLI